MPSLGSETSSSEEGDAKIRSLQRQLDDLRGGAVRVLRLARVRSCEEDQGLLDCGATHPLRPAKMHEDVQRYKEVKIMLAGGQQMKMRMSPGGAIIGSPAAEPIVPLGMLVARLNCILQWTDDHLVLSHPTLGQIPTDIKECCPMVSKDMALKLIEELEGLEGSPMMRSMNVEDPMAK